MFAGMALALVIWLSSTQFWPLAIFAFIFGTAYGGWVALLPAVIMDYFGGRNVSGLIGILYTSAGIGTLIGPSATGYIFDATQSYTLPIVVSIAGNIIAAIIMAVTARMQMPENRRVTVRSAPTSGSQRAPTLTRCAR